MDRCRFFYFLVLIFVVLNCSPPSIGESPVSVYWNDSIPAGLTISRDVIPYGREAFISESFEVHLADDNGDDPVLGDWILGKRDLIFKSVVPLTRSMRYEVIFNGERLGSVRVPPQRAEVYIVNVYPTQDSLPENLLKMYIQFSRPMSEGEPLQFVKLLDQESDTLHDVFLDLRPALWNREGTLLTLWLDPGRIKRDLKPNERLGPPLEQGRSYSLRVESWPSKDGSRTKAGVVKEFTVVKRDVTSPSLSGWKLQPPKSGTSTPLFISTGESMDFVLMGETMRLVGPEGTEVPGRFLLEQEETLITFAPEVPWLKGDYTLICESRLEDLAGNNLSRLFDHDLTRDVASEQPSHRLTFSTE